MCKCSCCEKSCIPLIFRCRGTVICRIWWQVLLCALWATAVALVHHYYPQYHLHVESDALQGAAVITGMLLVFRTNTAYDRFWEGRKLWANLVSEVRILCRTLWVYVDDKHDSNLLIEKVTSLNLMVAFLYATKHYIREEYSYDEEDIRDYTAHLPKMNIPSSNTPGFQQDDISAAPQKVVQNRQKAEFKKLKEDLKNKKPGATMPMEDKEDLKPQRRESFFVNPNLLEVAETNIPVEISYYITSYIVSIKERSLVDNPICRVLDTACGNLIKNLTALERIRRTPIPIAYAVHLHHVAWIIVLVLPFQWTQELKFMAIFAVSLASFAMLGILSIGREIENPFGYDYNDLNLDDYCHALHKEVIALMSKPLPKPETWINSDKNRPIVTEYDLDAPTLMKMSYKKVAGLLGHGIEHHFGKSNTSLYSLHHALSKSNNAGGAGDHKV